MKSIIVFFEEQMAWDKYPNAITKPKPRVMAWDKHPNAIIKPKPRVMAWDKGKN